MNLRMKRCLFGLMTWAALTGVAVAQSPNESEGMVRLGAPRKAAVTQAAAVQTADAQAADTQPMDAEGRVRVGLPPATPGMPPVPPSPSSPDQVPPMPPPLPPVGANPGGLIGYTPVDRMFQPRFNVNSYGGGLYGYNAGYATAGAFVPFAIEGDESLLFVDARGLATYDGRGGGNVGAGWRWWMREYDRIIGLSAWYDSTSGGIGGNFNQMGLSYESLGRYVDYRINGYIPAGQHDHFGASSLATNATCVGNNIAFVRSTQVAQAFTGFDIETGGPLPIIGRYGVNGYIGGYHFMGAGTGGGSFTGVSGRWLAQINEDVQFGMQVTNDHTFGLNTQFQVFVTLPDGVPSRWMRNMRVQDRLTQQVFRQYRAITHIDTVQTFEVATNAATDKPFFVAFIDPNQTTPGNGTDGKPFNSIAQFNALTAAQRSSYDIIVVDGRTDGTSTNLDTGASNAAPAGGLHLFNDQQLWAASVAHTFTTPTGTFQFLCDGGVTATPILVNNEAFGGPGGGSVITLANNNVVSGFTIDGTNPLGVQNSGIVSQSGGITGNFNINHNTFQNTLAGVQLMHSGSGLGLLTDNTVTGGPATGLAVGFQSNLGLSVTQTSGTLSLLALNNKISDVKGEDANGNGVLDAGEDTNGNGSLDLGIGMQFIATGATAVINADDPTNTTQPLAILNNTVSGSGAGLQIEALAGGTFNASVIGNSLSNNTAGSHTLPTPGFGFAASAIGAGSTMTIDTYTDNTTNNNEGDGAVLTANNGGLLTVTSAITGPAAGGTTTGDTFNGNSGDGMRIQSDGGQVIVSAITDTTFDSNGQNGLNLVTTNGGVITITDPLSNDTFANNGLAGLAINSGSGTINVSLNPAANSNTFSGNGTAATAATGAAPGAGLLFEVSTGGVLNTDLQNMTITGSAGDGVEFLLNGGVINVATIQGNVLTGNKLDGLAIINNNGGIFNVGAIGGLSAGQGNDFSNNGRAGLFFGGGSAVPDSFNNIGLIAGNNFDRTTSGTVGILFDTLSVFTTNSGGAITVVQNSFVGGNNSTSEGVGGTVNRGGVNLAFGGVNPADANTFTANRDADIGLVLSGSSVNTITIDNHNLSGVINGADPNFAGVGVGFILKDSASLTGFIQRSTISNNASDGIFISGDSDDPTTFTTLNNFVIGGTTPGLGNTITGNGGNGINITRIENGQINNLQILNNTITTNGLNGISITSSGANTEDTITINSNNVSLNGLDGILLSVQADASMFSTIDSNTIDGNGTFANGLFGSGIHTVEQENSPSDTRTLFGVWTRNTITNNALDGIDLASALGDLTLGNPLIIGDPVDTSLGNTISSNHRNGINVEGAGDVLIGSNTISANGTAGTVSTANETAGIMAHVLPTSNLTIINNQIVNNIGDGVQYCIRQGFSGFSSQVQIIGNTISFNDGRGVNIMNRNNNFIQVTIDSNTINSNLLEGIYVVNTSSGTQDQWKDSSQLLDQNGGIFQDPIIEMQISNNIITGNGAGTSFETGPLGPPTATGLYIRVGTSTATSDWTDPGGFASVGAPVAVGGNPFGNSTFEGGVTTTVDNNTFGGNFGDDVLFQSFTSTPLPGTASGKTWDQTTFDPTGYRSNPLARLDLYFRNNTFDSTDVNNSLGVNGADLPGGPGAAQTAAWYNETDGVFKSRLNSIAAPNVPGPFNFPDRLENAQRQAARLPFADAPFTGPNIPGTPNTFLYPGMGPSTFRVSSDSQTALFILDVTPYNFTFDASGFQLPNGQGEPDNMPYGWGQF